MIKLQRLNVVKEVDSEERAGKLEGLGFHRIAEPKEEKTAEPKESAGKGKKAGRKPDEEKKEGDNSESGTGDADNSGSNGQS